MISAANGVNSAESIRTDYLSLLITQLRNQDPMEPMDNAQMAGQLAQLSELELLENMNGTFEQALLTAEVNQATSLIGRQVTFVSPDDGWTYGGTVQGVDVSDGQVLLNVGGYRVGLETVRSIL